MTYKWKNDSCIKSMDNKEINMNEVEAMLMLAISKLAEDKKIECGHLLVMIARELFGMSDAQINAHILLAKIAEITSESGIDLASDITEDIGEGVN